MSAAIMRVNAFVNNVPLGVIMSEYNFMVARLVENDLWYYGLYETRDRAKEVAKELENGLVLEVVDHE